PAKLLFENSDVQSALPINIIVKGYATLEANFTNFQGVNIVALEHSRIILRNVTMMGGSLTTSWDSWANISLIDTAMNNPVVLSGNSRGYFTDSVLPSIDVEDDAEAWVYRWIYVTVRDGAGQPLPDAVVTAYRYADGKYAGYAISGDAAPFLGVARVNALATILKSDSTQSVGNYRLSAVYSFGGDDYLGDEEISVGVMPYSEPLTWNATFTSINISSALPKLSVPDPVTVWPASPVKNNLTYVNATVANVGVTGAYNVEVYFFDDVTASSADPDPTVPFATVVVPTIAPGDEVVVTARWLATYPVGAPHRMLVVVDPNNLIKEIDETATTPPAEGEGFVTVQSLADFYVTQIYTSPLAVVVDVTCTVNAVVHNGGDQAAANVEVEFYDGIAFIDTYTIPFIEAGGDATASVSYAFATYSPPDHTVIARVNPAHAVVELDYTNNNASQLITVLEPPNMRLANLYFVPVDQVPGGDQVTVRASLSNLKPAPFSNPTVRLTVSYTLDGELHTSSQDMVVPYVFTFDFGPVTVSMSFISPVVNTRTTLDVTMEVNPAHSPAESTYTDNTVTGSIDALDVRADLSISAQNIYVQSNGGNITGEEFGRVVTIYALVDNLGGRPVTNFQVQLGWNNSVGYNKTLLLYPFANISAVAGDHTTLISFSWTINITTPGTVSIWVLVDGPDNTDEPNENNNFAAAPFTINELDMNIKIDVTVKEYDAGDEIVVTVTFTYVGSSVPVKGLPGVQLSLYNTATETIAPGSATGLLNTSANGKVSVNVIVPTTIESGTYQIQVEVTSTGHTELSDSLQITGAVEEGMFPWWFWWVIIIIAVAAVGGAFAYTYVFGLGKLVECGECGAFISAAEKRCPKCGVEFEVGTMKCSECGAWIPAESAECPNCGVKFVGEVEEEKDYLERMRKEYEEMVSKYRELAKAELGKKYNEKHFQEWWTKQTAYISFEDWLAKEEEKKKEGPVPCPVCGTLNPKEATVCHKCGTVFGAPRPAGAPPKGPPPAAPPGAGVQQGPAGTSEEQMPAQQAQAPPAAGPPRMVIRRPIDRKVIPKKIIKTPTGEEKTEGEENQ
ncbi:MAG: hypothetical protein MUC90_04605, partial [Thermoplasmata archaeon]|nr:hypothetical protein [Thermoplasmata archaeon]